MYHAQGAADFTEDVDIMNGWAKGEQLRRHPSGRVVTRGQQLNDRDCQDSLGANTLKSEIQNSDIAIEPVFQDSLMNLNPGF